MRRTIEVDMSPEAIDRRLRDLGQLYRLWPSLREARYLGKAEELGPRRFKIEAPPADRVEEPPQEKDR